MFPKYVVELLPREGELPCVSVKLQYEIELLVAPEFRASLSKIDRGTYDNPFIDETTPASWAELLGKIKAALAVVDTYPDIPRGAKLVLEEGRTEQHLNLLDLVNFDAALSQEVSVRIEGKGFPNKLVFLSGLHRWELPYSNLDEAKLVADDLQNYITAINDPQNVKYIPSEGQRKTATQISGSGFEKIKEEIDAQVEFLKAAKDPNSDLQKEKQRLDQRTAEPREPDAFRRGENDGFRGDGGFFK